MNEMKKQTKKEALEIIEDSIKCNINERPYNNDDTLAGCCAVNEYSEYMLNENFNDLIQDVYDDYIIDSKNDYSKNFYTEKQAKKIIKDLIIKEYKNVLIENFINYKYVPKNIITTLRNDTQSIMLSIFKSLNKELKEKFKFIPFTNKNNDKLTFIYLFKND